MKNYFLCRNRYGREFQWYFSVREIRDGRLSYAVPPQLRGKDNLPRHDKNFKTMKTRREALQTLHKAFKIVRKISKSDFLGSLRKEHYEVEE